MRRKCLGSVLESAFLIQAALPPRSSLEANWPIITGFRGARFPSFR